MKHSTTAAAIPPARRLYGVPELAEQLSVTNKCIWDLLYSGQLASVKLGRRRLIPAAEVERFLGTLTENDAHPTTQPRLDDDDELGAPSPVDDYPQSQMSSAPRERGAGDSRDDHALGRSETIVPQPPVSWNGRVHPVAECFPMLAGDDAEELALDIKANGLAHPIVLDAEGTLVDGRNRLRACDKARVPPHFTVLAAGADIESYVMSANIIRRQLDAGQRAMIVARIRKVCGKLLTTTEAAEEAGVSQSSMKYAAVVVKHGDDKLGDEVITGARTLDSAYHEVKPTTKRAKSRASDVPKAQTSRRPRHDDDLQRLQDFQDTGYRFDRAADAVVIATNRLPDHDDPKKRDSYPYVQHGRGAVASAVQKVNDALEGLSDDLPSLEEWAEIVTEVDRDVFWSNHFWHEIAAPLLILRRRCAEWTDARLAQVSRDPVGTEVFAEFRDELQRIERVLHPDIEATP